MQAFPCCPVLFVAAFCSFNFSAGFTRRVSSFVECKFCCCRMDRISFPKASCDLLGGIDFPSFFCWALTQFQLIFFGIKIDKVETFVTQILVKKKKNFQVSNSMQHFLGMKYFSLLLALLGKWKKCKFIQFGFRKKAEKSSHSV